MPALSVATPKYRRDRASGQAVVTLAGVDHYLGPCMSVASVAEYDRLVAEWLLRGRTGPPAPQADGLTVAEAIAAYWQHAKTYYRSADGRPTSELGGIKAAFRPILRLYGRQPVAVFGPLALKGAANAAVVRRPARHEPKTPASAEAGRLLHHHIVRAVRRSRL